MYAFTDQVLTIGAKNKNVNFNEYPGDYMNGQWMKCVFTVNHVLATVRRWLHWGRIPRRRSNHHGTRQPLF
jgi:hypothetical protein